MLFGLDILGALTQAQAKRERAAASGQRAVAAGQKLAKRAPRLSAAIVAAGQKALKAGGAKAAVPTTAAAPAPPTNRAPTTQRTVAAPASRLVQQARHIPAPVPRMVPSAVKRTTKVGDDETADEQQADLYTQLADGASKVADFMAYFQGLIDRLPPDLPLAQNGLGVISQLQNWFATPLEAAMQGDQQALAKTQDINDVVQSLIDQQDATEKRWPWDWAEAATAYLQIHPSAAPVGDPSGTADGSTGIPVAGTTVAKVMLSPQGLSATLGTPMQFTATPLNSAGKPTTPINPIAWSASAGASIDQTGLFTATTAGTYTIKANVDGVTATTTVIAQPSAAPMSMPAGGGGYGGDSGGAGYGADSGGSDYGADAEYAAEESYPDEGGGEQYAEEMPAEEPHAEEADSSEDETFEPTDEIGGLLAVLGKGGGGHGGGHGGHGHGGHHRRARENGDGWTGPWFYGAYGIDAGEPFDDDSVDNLAEAVADKLARKNHTAVGLDCLGDDSWLTVHTPGDYKNAVAALKMNADALNLTATGEPGWKGLYDNAVALYEKYKDVGFFSSINPFSDTGMTQTTWNLIADTQRRIDEFAAQMRSQGKKVVTPEHKPVDDSLIPTGDGSTLDWLKKHWPWLAGAGVAAVVVPVILPPIIGAAVAARARR